MIGSQKMIPVAHGDLRRGIPLEEFVADYVLAVGARIRHVKAAFFRPVAKKKYSRAR